MVKQKAGHRSWAPKGGKISGSHQGDIMSREKRSQLMQKIKSRNTSPELKLAAALSALGLAFDRHPKTVLGKPDFVFPAERLAVFVDGDFWHGWRFPLWKHKLSPFWQEKISKNRERDARTFRRLRRQGWRVLRIWEHQVETDAVRCAARILEVFLVKTETTSRITGGQTALPIRRILSRRVMSAQRNDFGKPIALASSGG